jgi:hypothetical protein
MGEGIMTGTEYFIAMVVITVLSTSYQIIQAKKQRKAAKDAAEARKGYELVVDGEIMPIPIVYGRAKIGGVRTYHGTSSWFVRPSTFNADKIFSYGGSEAGFESTRYGNYNEYLYFQQVLCHGPIHNVYDFVAEEKLYANDPAIWSIRNEVHFCTSDVNGVLNCVSNNMISENISERRNARFPGLAYATTVTRLNRDDPQFNGVPMVQYFIEGRLVRKVTYNSAEDLYELTNQREYSNNPAWCLLDYLLVSELKYVNNEGDEVYVHDPGAKLDVSQINLKSFYQAAQICDKVVLNDVKLTGKIWKSTDPAVGRTVESRNIPLYECNLIIDPQKPIRNNIETLLSTMGDARLVWSKGQYKLSLKYPIV